MPPKAKFTKEEVIQAAIEIVRTAGMKGLTARALASALKTSVCPIFTLFNGMEEVQAGVISAANTLYESYLTKDMHTGVYPPYKASGMAYIRFAKEEKELFQILFMRNREGEKIEENKEAIQPLLRLIQEGLNITEEKAYLFHLEMWVFVHGIATMAATSYLDWDLQFISNSLTDVYQGLCYRFGGRNE